MLRKLAALWMVIFAILRVVEAQGLRGSGKKAVAFNGVNMVPVWHGLRGIPAITSGASVATEAIWQGLRGAMRKKPVPSPCATCVPSSDLRNTPSTRLADQRSAASSRESSVPATKTNPVASHGPSILPSSAMPTAGSGKRTKVAKEVKVPSAKAATPELAFKKDDGFRWEL